MKKIIFLIAAAAMLSSCESWLDVKPKSQIEQNYLFRNEAGFRAALIGVYTDLGERSLYGGNLTLGFNDVLAQYYTIPAGNLFFETSRYDYGSGLAMGMIADVWSSGYNAIANLNNLLDQLEQKGPDFFPDERYYGILKGEAMALRAMVHFDLLRLVGPSPVTGMETSAIPFVDRLSKAPFESITVRQMIDRCLDELEEASALLREVDSASPHYLPEYVELDNATDQTQGSNDFSYDSRFLLDRNLRLNWMAVRALMARVALYGGDRTAAGNYAGECIETGMFTAADQLFSLHIDILHMFVENYFTTKTTYVGGLAMTDENRWYFYETTLYIGEKRNTQWFIPAVDESNAWVMTRFTRPLNAAEGTEYPQHMPMIDAAEVYLIYAECATDETDRYRAINDERAVFDLTGNEALSPATHPDLETEIAKEYRKRFIGEGQMFYYMKRTDATVVNRANGEVIAIPARAYTMMDNLPEDEYNYGKIEQR